MMWGPIFLGIVLVMRCAYNDNIILQDIIKEIKNGVIVPQPRPIKVQRGTWRVVIVLKDPNIEHAKEEREKLKRMASKMTDLLKHHSPCKREHQFNQWLNICIDSRVKRYLLNRLSLLTSDEMDIFHIKTAPVQRIKRGWIDMGGSLLKRVFGTATEQDIREVKVATAKTRKQGARVHHEVARLTTVIDHAIAEQNRERKRLNEINEHLERFHNTTAEIYSLIDTRGKLNLMRESIHYLELIRNELKEEEAKNSRIIHDLDSGRLTENIFPRELLGNIARQVRIKGLEALPTIWYYENCKIELILIEAGQYVFRVELPFVDTKDFLLYEIKHGLYPSVATAILQG